MERERVVRVIPGVRGLGDMLPRRACAYVRMSTGHETQMRYIAILWEMVRAGKDDLVRHWTTEMGRMLRETEALHEWDYRLIMKVLDYIEVIADGKMAVIFPIWTRVTEIRNGNQLPGRIGF